MRRNFFEYLRIKFKHRGRGWDAGDCFNLALLFYSKEFGIDLGDLPEEYDLDWAQNGGNYFTDLYEKWGFTKVSAPEFGDGVLFSTNGVVAHCGVVIDPSEGKFLHTSRVGTHIDNYVTTAWAAKLSGFYRFKDLRT
jgi:hypothetical protein